MKATQVRLFSLFTLSALLLAGFSFTTGRAAASSGTITGTQTGLVASDTLTTGMTTQWTFGGDAATEPGAKYSYLEDSLGLHISAEPPAGGTWAGYYAVSGPTNAGLFHALVTLSYSSVPDNGFNTGIYVQTSNGDFIDYIGCLAVAVPQGYYWTVVQSYGVLVGAQVINPLYKSPINTLPRTEDCTIITNGNNYLKVYLGSTAVVDRNNMTLNIPPPFQVYLEPQSSTASALLTGTYVNYYATTGEAVIVKGAPAGSTAKILDASANVLSSALADSTGTATMNLGKYAMPLSANIAVYDSTGALLASTPSPKTIWGGDVYTVTYSPTTTTTSSITTSSTSTSTSTSMTTTATSTTITSTSSVAGTSILTVNSQVNGGGTTSGYYTVLYHNNVVAATGYTPAQFTLVNGQTYEVGVDGYNNYYFQYWSNTGSVNGNFTLTANSNTNLVAVLCNGPPGTCKDPTPVGGITVYAHRIQSSYWDPCFATACSAGTGPGATMYFILEDASGNVLQTGFANEAGYTFSGLSPGVTYYVYPDDCSLCHGSQHDVVFAHWGNNSATRPIAVTVGASLDAWYSCTNNCA